MTYGQNETRGRRRKSLRDIVEINENLCDGCGECLPSCAEGALVIEGGRVALKADALCDGLGACIGVCPKGALSLIRRLSDDFQAPGPARPRRRPSAPWARPGAGPAMAAPPPPPPEGDGVMEALEGVGGEREWPGLTGVGDCCPATVPGGLPCHGEAMPGDDFGGEARSLASWPIQLALVPPKSPFLGSGTLILASDCVAFTGPHFHRLFLGHGHPVVIGCPKLDDRELYVAKLGAILRDNPGLTRVLIPIMDVPCCRGMWRLAKEAHSRSRRHDVAVLGWVFSVSGRPLESSVNVLIS